MSFGVLTGTHATRCGWWYVSTGAYVVWSQSLRSSRSGYRAFPEAWRDGREHGYPGDHHQDAAELLQQHLSEVSGEGWLATNPPGSLLQRIQQLTSWSLRWPPRYIVWRDKRFPEYPDQAIAESPAA